jgi:hypothetical protein
MSDVSTSSKKCASGDDQRSFGGLSTQHCITRGGAHHCAIQVVRVILHEAIVVYQVGVDRLVREASGGVANHVGRIDKFPAWQAKHATLSAFLAFDGWLKVGGEPRKRDGWTITYWRRFWWEPICFSVCSGIRTWKVAEAEGRC